MKWVSSFKYLPLNYGMTVANVENKTQRVTFDNNLNGNSCLPDFMYGPWHGLFRSCFALLWNE